MLGPVFARELASSPRRARLYVTRSAYVAALLLLASTAWLVLAGTQDVRDLGDLARFGAALFQILAPLQLALALFFSALQAAGAVCQEKDRRTLVLLLITRLTNHELVLGKLAAGLLGVVVVFVAALPVTMLMMLWGGVSPAQVARVAAVTAATILAAGSLGSTLALWREKTFQALSIVVLALVLWLALGEIVARGAFGETLAGAPAAAWADGLSPWRAVQAAARPSLDEQAALPRVGEPTTLFLLVAGGVVVCLNGLAILRVRVWNPSRELQPTTETGRFDEEAAQSAPARSIHAAPGRTRPVWDNPVLWREVRTWAYGRRVLLVKLAYLLLAGVSAAALVHAAGAAGGISRAAASFAVVPLMLISLILINAQAVTALTTERDLKSLDLLLVTDITAREFVFGKILGVLYNTKEMVLLPALLCAALWWAGGLRLENLVYVLGGLAVMIGFVVMLGLHAGLTYVSSRTAIAVSLGTVFFLFLGVATCMRIMLAFAGSFEVQLQPFLAFMLGGFVGLYAALGARNPSPAIALASFLCPFATFYALTIYWLEYSLGVFLVVSGTYGFTTAAMLIPAIFEFDSAVGRTTAAEE